MTRMPRLPEPEWVMLDWVCLNVWGKSERRVRPRSYGLLSDGVVDTASVHSSVVETALASRAGADQVALREHVKAAADFRVPWGRGLNPGLWIAFRRDVLEGARVAYDRINSEHL